MIVFNCTKETDSKGGEWGEHCLGVGSPLSWNTPTCC